MQPISTILALLGAALPAQDPPSTDAALVGEAPIAEPADGIRIDGVALDNARCIHDPRGVLQVSGKLDGVRRAWRIRFPELALLEPEVHEIGKREDQVRVLVFHADRAAPAQTGETGGDGVGAPAAPARVWEPMSNGRLVVTRHDLDRFEGAIKWRDESKLRTVEVSSAVEVRRVRQPSVIGAPEEQPASPAPADQPAPEDLVFCAIGNTGTGMPGAARVVSQIADLAASGPLDMVLLTGNVLGPNGVQSRDDGAWQTYFEHLFDRQRLDVPFYVALGAQEREGDESAMINYGGFGTRWTFPKFSYSFELESHGQKFLFVSADTISMVQDLTDPLARAANRFVTQPVDQREADWKIVFGHLPLFSGGPIGRDPASAELRKRQINWFEKGGVDLYIGGADHTIELIGPHRGTFHVNAGGGGGPETADPVHWQDDTVYAFTGGGFVWFRFDGKQLEVSLRDIDGVVRYTHYITKS